MLGSSRVAALLAASKEGLSSMKLEAISKICENLEKMCSNGHKKMCTSLFSATLVLTIFHCHKYAVQNSSSVFRLNDIDMWVLIQGMLGYTVLQKLNYSQ
jgi:uncharacterized membrane protein YdcZ (DUF606 family)